VGWFSNVFQIFGGGEKSHAVDSDGASVVGPQPLFDQFERIGGGLTPGQVSSIIRDADTGNIRRFVDLANESRQKDGHLQSVLSTRELSLKALDWEIQPPEEASEPEKQWAKRCQQALKESANFADLISFLQGANYYGHATAEVIYGIADDGLMTPAEFSFIGPRRFVFDQRTGKLLWSDHGSSADGVDLVEEFPGTFLQYQPRVNGDVPAREGLARVLIWPALFRNWSVRDWLQLGEIGWKPWVFGKYKKGAPKEDTAALRDIIGKIATTGRATMPDTFDIDVMWPTGQVSRTTSEHRELYDAMGREISKAVIGGTLTVEAGDKGARSLGDVHDLVRSDLMLSDAVGVGGLLNRMFVAEWYRLNAPASIRRGEFFFHTEDAVDLVAFAGAVDKLVKAGTKIPQAWVRDRAAIREPKEDEEILVPTAPVPAEPVEEAA